MRSKGFDGMTCSIADVMGAIGDRWGALILRDVLLGLRRYDEFQHSTGVTNATLSDRLKALERDGLIARRPYQERPARYEYLPTARGRDVGLVILAMLQVGDLWRAAEGVEPPLVFEDAETGRKLRLALVDAETGMPIATPHPRAEAGPGADEVMRWRLQLGATRGGD